MEIRWMTADDVDHVVSATELFDNPVQREHAADFLSLPTHHIAIAYVDDAPAGFVSGMEIADATAVREMLLYELGVEEEFQRRGIGKALVAALRERALGLGCRGMWVLTDHDNEAAIATYQSAGAGEPLPQVMLEWDLT